MKSILWGVLFLMVAATFGQAQTRAISGTVTAFKDIYLKNIRVSAKKSKATVSTDSMGRYNIVCEKKDKLTFTGNGFEQVTRSTNKKVVVDVKMVFLEGAKNEEIAVGYGHISKDKLTYAVSNLTDYNNDFSNYTDIFSLMQGKFSGVQIVNVNGEKKVLVRGVSSNSDNIYALYIVDGVVVDGIGYLSPTSIKSIDILKDGNSIYGSRGANGVVLINTVGH